MSEFKVDIYSTPHKDFRKMIFESIVLAGSVDLLNTEQARNFEESARNMLSTLREHAHNENTYAHPIIFSRLPLLKEKTEKEHTEHGEELDHIEAELEKVLASKDPNQSLEFYRSLNRFAAAYLMHLDEEEASLKEIWKVCRSHELFAIMVAFKGLEEPSSFPFFFGFAQQNLSAEELEQMFNVIEVHFGHDACSKLRALRT